MIPKRTNGKPHLFVTPLSNVINLDHLLVKLLRRLMSPAKLLSHLLQNLDFRDLALFMRFLNSGEGLSNVFDAAGNIATARR